MHIDLQENEDHVTDSTVAASAEHEDTSTEIASAEHEDTSTEIAITVFGRNQKWTFHCDEYQPLVTTLFIPLLGEPRRRTLFFTLRQCDDG